MNRKKAKRSVIIEVAFGQDSAAKPRKRLRDHIKDLWHGKELNRLDVELDGRFYCSLSPEDGYNWTRIVLDEHSHTITLQHDRLKPNYPKIEIPADYNTYYFTAAEANNLRIEQTGVLPPIPHIDFKNSPVTMRIIEHIADGLNGEDLYHILQSRQAWSMWLECWEGGVQLGFFTTDDHGSRSTADLLYKDFCRGDLNEYDELCTADAIAMEQYLIERVKELIPKESNIEFFYEDRFYGARYNVDVLDCTTTWELRNDLVEKWKPHGEYYQALHEYDVFYSVMEFSEKAITFHFEGYGNERKQLPVPRTTYYAGQASGSTARYTCLRPDESEILENFLVNQLEYECEGRIWITPISGRPHCYRIDDNRKLHYKGQEPYWSE